MPANKHKRKASTHVKSKTTSKARSSGLITSHPKAFAVIGLLFIVLGISLLVFKGQSDAMFGLAMLALVGGVATTIYAKFSLPQKTQHK